MTGLAGWASFGVAGLVLSWFLLIDLPATRKREDAKEVAHQAQMQTVLDGRDRLLSEQLNAERASCEKRHEQNLEEWRNEREIR